MKTLKSFLAITLALASIGAVSAQTKTYITGSTAFRSATVAAITSTLSGTVSIAYDGNTSGVTSQSNANAVTWTGGNIGGTAVTIKASWSGSAAGIQTVAGTSGGGAPFNVRFLPDGATGSANNDPRAGANANEAANPDISMADNYQGTTPFNGTFQSVVYSSLLDNLVGIVTFKWAASVGFPANQSMTPQLAENLYQNLGITPLSMWTGVSGDRTVGVYATGRNPDSGTRITTFAESGIGVFRLVQQWQPTLSGATITALQLYPVESINGVSTQVDGNSGENSGSSLRNFLTKTLTSGAYQTWDPSLTNGYMLTYLGVSDFNSVSGSGAVGLFWNGVDFSQAAVMEGKYTFWGYEHLDYKSNLGNGTTGGPAVKLSFATNLKNNIVATSSATLNPNVKLSDMQVKRFVDGGRIDPTFAPF